VNEWIASGVGVKGESTAGVLIAVGGVVGVAVRLGFAVAVGDRVEVQALTNRSEMTKTALGLPISLSY
jgi:hypothetical protein